MQFGASTFIWVSPFSSETLDLVDKVATLGFDLIEVCIEDPATIDTAAIRRRIEAAGIGATRLRRVRPDRDMSADDPAVAAQRDRLCQPLHRHRRRARRGYRGRARCIRRSAERAWPSPRSGGRSGACRRQHPRGRGVTRATGCQASRSSRSTGSRPTSSTRSSRASSSSRRSDATMSDFSWTRST